MYKNWSDIFDKSKNEKAGISPEAAAKIVADFLGLYDLYVGPDSPDEKNPMKEIIQKIGFGFALQEGLPKTQTLFFELEKEPGTWTMVHEKLRRKFERLKYGCSGSDLVAKDLNDAVSLYTHYVMDSPFGSNAERMWKEDYLKTACAAMMKTDPAALLPLMYDLTVNASGKKVLKDYVDRMGDRFYCFARKNKTNIKGTKRISYWTEPRENLLTWGLSMQLESARAMIESGNELPSETFKTAAQSLITSAMVLTAGKQEVRRNLLNAWSTVVSEWKRTDPASANVHERNVGFYVSRKAAGPYRKTGLCIVTQRGDSMPSL